MSLGLADTPFREATKPLLRPNQVVALKGDEARLEGTLNAPEYIQRGIQDRASLMKQLKSIKTDLEGNVPTAYPMDSLDTAKHRHDELLADITAGMPTQAEMRRRPPGAVDKHMGWEKRNKDKILELKNIRLRLYESGAIEAGDGSEVANIERFRPVGGSQELAMEGALIQGKQFFMPDKVTPAAVLTEADAAVLQEHDPALLDVMALLDNKKRAEVIRLARALASSDAPAQARPKKAKAPRKKKPDGRKTLSPAVRAARSQRMKDFNAKQRADKQAKAQAQTWHKPPTLAQEG